jgi:hypothetical protein
LPSAADIWLTVNAELEVPAFTRRVKTNCANMPRGMKELSTTRALGSNDFTVVTVSPTVTP